MPDRPLHFSAFVMNTTGHIGRGPRLPETHPAARYRRVRADA